MSSDTRLFGPKTQLLPARPRRGHRREVAPGVRAVPAVLEARPGGPAERVAARLAGKSPALAFITVLVVGYVGLAALSIAIGLVVIHVLLPLSGVSSADESVVVWLVHHRSPTGTDASLVGSTMAGGLVLPVLVAVIAVVCVVRRWWRVAAFVVFALIVESATYRVTTLVVHRHRPTVLALSTCRSTPATRPGTRLRRSRFTPASRSSSLLGSRDRRVRTLAWTIAVAMPIVRRRIAHVPRHAPPDRLAGRRARSASARS